MIYILIPKFYLFLYLRTRLINGFSIVTYAQEQIFSGAIGFNIVRHHQIPIAPVAALVEVFYEVWNSLQKVA